MVVCRFYGSAQGCRFGESCRFEHVADTADGEVKTTPSMPVCHFFKANPESGCRNGENCKFLHPEALSAGAQSTNMTSSGTDSSHTASRFSGLEKENNAKTAVKPNENYAVHDATDAMSKMMMRGAFNSAPGGTDEDPEDEGGMLGFSSNQVDELLSQGVKPWEDGAGDVLDALDY